MASKRALSTLATSLERLAPCMPLRQPKRHFTTTLVRRKDDSDSQSRSTVYAMPDIQALITSSKPDPHRILIDVREPSELQSTGKIPGSQNLPIKSAPDAFFLGPEEFEERFGWQKPGPNDEVIFYCKAGVRSRAAAQLAGQAGFGGKIGEFPGSWVEWEGKGGEVEREK
ncbi:Thiosulfate sulfurtransferase rdl2, mitochondrial [Exophiala xenobiotica]|nr:Thiosulfate sulfurtransferase rdl2, mitochondrial [Exophiala xenobiotica]